MKITVYENCTEYDTGKAIVRIHPGKLTAEERRAVLEDAAKQFIRSLQKQGKEGVLVCSKN